ncbi:MAG: tetratricopeptide repeat protein [Flavobacteriaceae bacterium]|nr:tetratricopeptide repeat protein [Flavobacteriaceae bacterium]
MKKQLIIASAMLLGTFAQAQKAELKIAKKAIKKGNYELAVSSLEDAKKLIENADDKLKAQFYYLDAQATYAGGTDESKFAEAGAKYTKLLSFEEKIGKAKYSNSAAEIVNTLITSLAGSASKSFEAKEYKKASADFYAVYTMSPVDTSYLENSAFADFHAKNNENSNEKYNKLLDMKYTGIYTVYTAVDLEGKTVNYGTNKQSRDLQVKISKFTEPKDEAKESRLGTIYKMMALNYSSLEKYEESLAKIAEGKKILPGDYDLVITEANIYLKQGDDAGFKSSLEEAVKINPTDPVLYYNIGVMSIKQKKTEEAISFFEKAIELKPDYAEAYYNIGVAIIEQTSSITEEMNNNLNNYKKYDALDAKRIVLYKKALPNYIKASELDPKNIDTLDVLKNIYSQLAMDKEENEIKAKIEALK